MYYDRDNEEDEGKSLSWRYISFTIDGGTDFHSILSCQDSSPHSTHGKSFGHPFEETYHMLMVTSVNFRRIFESAFAPFGGLRHSKVALLPAK